MTEQEQARVILSLGLLTDSLLETLQVVEDTKTQINKGNQKEDIKKSMTARLDHYTQMTSEMLLLIPEAKDLLLSEQEKEAEAILKRVRIGVAFIHQDATELLIYGGKTPTNKEDLH